MEYAQMPRLVKCLKDRSTGGRKMTLSDLYRKVKSINSYLNSADMPLKCNGKDFNIDFEIVSKDAIISHIEVKQDLALSWEDILKIGFIADEMDAEGIVNNMTQREYCEEVSKRFNEQRKK